VPPELGTKLHETDLDPKLREALKRLVAVDHASRLKVHCAHTASSRAYRHRYRHQLADVYQLGVERPSLKMQRPEHQGGRISRE